MSDRTRAALARQEVIDNSRFQSDAPQAEAPPGSSRLGMTDVASLHRWARIPSGANKRQALLLIALDDLDVIDDRLGPNASEGVRDAFAERISFELRVNASAAKLDDRTFAVVLRGVREGEARDLNRRLVEALARPVMVAGVLLVCRAHLGLATASSPTECATLWRRAYAVLTANAGHSRKARGAEHWSSRDEKSTPARCWTSEIHPDLEMALDSQDGSTPDDDGLTVHYQPILDLAESVTRGFEALVRWQHPSHGLIPAAEVVGAAERTGLIRQLGDWVLGQAIAAAAALESARSAPGYVSVNVSAAQLLQPDFAERTRRRVAIAGLDPSRLVIEITESQVIQDDKHVWHDLADLRDLGIRVAIDDYGTGYASLAYLRHPVIDMLKLDRTFVADICQPRGRTILQSVVALANSLDIVLVAEGIEDESTRSTLVDSGCTLGQGYLYAAAMPLSHAMRWDPDTKWS